MEVILDDFGSKAIVWVLGCSHRNSFVLVRMCLILFAIALSLETINLYRYIGDVISDWIIIQVIFHLPDTRSTLLCAARVILGL